MNYSGNSGLLGFTYSRIIRRGIVGRRGFSGGTVSRAPCRNLFVLPRLEGIPQRELNQSWCPHQAGDFAEAAAGFHVGHGRVPKIRVVPHIEEVGGEAQVLPLGNLYIFDQREVPVLLPRTTEDVAAEIAEAGCTEVGVDGTLRRVKLWRCRECSRIQITVDACADAAAGQRAGEGAAGRQLARQRGWS